MKCEWNEDRTCFHCGWHFPHDGIELPRVACPHPDTPKGQAIAASSRPRASTASTNHVTPSPPRPKGPGDFLHDTIRFWLRLSPTVGCGCEDKIRQMNVWGVAGCREHLEEIVGWLISKAKEDKWVTTKQDADGKEVAVNVPLSLNARIVRWMARRTLVAVQMEITCRRAVKRSIRKADRQAALEEASLYHQVLKSHRPEHCEEGMKSGVGKTPKEAWATCQRGDWMLENLRGFQLRDFVIRAVSAWQKECRESTEVQRLSALLLKLLDVKDWNQILRPLIYRLADETKLTPLRQADLVRQAISAEEYETVVRAEIQKFAATKITTKVHDDPQYDLRKDSDVSGRS